MQKSFLFAFDAKPLDMVQTETLNQDYIFQESFTAISYSFRQKPNFLGLSAVINVTVELLRLSQAHAHAEPNLSPQTFGDVSQTAR